ncbi:hypothetical protein Cni_G15637 [Canna indica]|uniref:Membrane-associated kinase regulator 4 n=1 Tax=Canna indica TaxID=4628 RepID=A0AAQ3KI86_9LILI|nr:hypothetical protein Cni_G15637 [Canna indica]
MCTPPTLYRILVPSPSPPPPPCNNMLKRSAMAMVEDDYIDMDISSSFICYTVNAAAASSPPDAKEFEFQMSADPGARGASTSPADELFYKGKLLPLHLPPRLRMVEKLERCASRRNAAGGGSPPSSCGDVDGGGGPSAGAEDPFACEGKKCSWSRKLKLIRRSSLCLRLKASRAYLRSLFIRSAAREGNPLEKQMEEELTQRKSFSSAVNWNSGTKSSSSSSSSSSLSSSFSSLSSLGTCEPQQTLKRSSSVNSEMESSILGAIAYCKESQQLVGGRKSADDVGFFFSLPAMALQGMNAIR